MKGPGVKGKKDNSKETFPFYCEQYESQRKYEINIISFLINFKDILDRAVTFFFF